MKHFFTLIFFALSISLTAQVSYDEMEFEDEELENSYTSTSKNFVLLKSKRGEGGMNTTPEADLLVTAKSKIKSIVLVYTETKEEDYDNREEANRERWENLIRTYPGFFQTGTVYKNVCQCSIGGDAEDFKKHQGFYVYVSGALPKAEISQPPAQVTSQPAETKKAETPAVTPKETVIAEPVKEIPKSEESPAQVVSQKTETPKQETKPVETPKQEVVKHETQDEEEEPVVKTPAKKPVKIRKAKDPKACRPACYGYSEDDINAFFRDNMVLSKKEKKKAKNWVANVSIKLNPDGSIKKTMVKGADPEVNKKVETALKSMNNWNAAVKNGITVKADVSFALRYDKTTKAMRPANFVMRPPATPKCKCVSDEEIFGD